MFLVSVDECILFFSVVGQWRMVRRALLAVGVGLLVVIATSVLVGLIFGSVSINSEIQARTSPNLIDFGIALGAGAAGSFAFTRARVSAAVAGTGETVGTVFRRMDKDGGGTRARTPRARHHSSRARGCRAAHSR